MTNLIIALIPLILLMVGGLYSVYWSNKRQKKKEQDKEPQPARMKFVPKGTFGHPLEDLKKIRRFLISNREWIVSKTKNYPLCIDMDALHYHTCVGNRADLNSRIRDITKEIKKAEEGFPTEFAQNIHEIMNKAKSVNKPKAKKGIKR